MKSIVTILTTLASVVALLVVVAELSHADIVAVGDRSSLVRVDNNGNNPDALVSLSGVRSRGVSFTTVNERIYYSDGTTIRSIERDGTSPLVHVSGGTAGIFDVVYDPVRQKVIWTEYATGLIRRANTDGSRSEIVVLTDREGPVGLAIDPTAGKIYWAEGRSGTVKRANVDGTNVETLATAQGTVYGLAVDVASGFVFWTSQTNRAIYRSTLVGTGQTSIVVNLPNVPYGIAVSPTKIYWLEGFGTLKRADKTGNNVESLSVISGAQDLDFSARAIGGGTATPTPAQTVSGTPNPNATPTRTPAGTRTPVATRTSTPTGTQTPGATPTAAPTGTVSLTPGPTASPTPLPSTISRASRLFGYALVDGTVPLPNVVINGGSLGTSLTDTNGRFEFLGATGGTTYLFTPERTGTSFSPGSAQLLARVGESVPFFAATVGMAFPAACTTRRISSEAVRFDANAKAIRDLTAQEASYLTRSERQFPGLAKSRAARNALVTSSRNTFLSIMGRTDDVPEVTADCTGVAGCSPVSLASVKGENARDLQALRRNALQMVRYTAAINQQRAASFRGAISRRYSAGSSIINDLPATTSSCN